MKLNPPKARKIFALCTHKGTAMLISLTDLLLLNLFLRNTAEQRKVRLQKTRSTVLMQTSADRLTQIYSPDLPAQEFLAKNVLRNHIVI